MGWWNQKKPKFKPGDVLEEIEIKDKSRSGPMRFLILEEYMPYDAKKPCNRDKTFYQAVKVLPWTIYGYLSKCPCLFREEWEDNFKVIGHIDLSLLFRGNEQIKMDFGGEQE